jgi:peptidoglycan/xylan/chitin deacetylase (PgdA/CDA1 family)
MTLKNRAWNLFSRITQNEKVEKKLRSSKNAIINYHSVGDPTKYGNVSLDRFERDLDLFLKQYNVTRLDEAILDNTPSMRLAITFDDGYMNFYKNALPLIKEKNIPVTVFISPKYIGDNCKEEIIDAHNLSECQSDIMMDENQIKNIIDSDLVTIGNHSWSHLDLSKINGIDKKRHQVENSKYDLEDRFHVSIECFSYPYGEYDQESARLVNESHDIGVTTEQTLIDSGTSQALIPRISGHKRQSVLQLELTELGQRTKHLYQSIPSIQDL